jgi:integrase
MRGHVVKKRGRYYVVVELDKDPGTGKRRRNWIGGFAKKKEADAALVETLHRLNQGTYVAPSRRTLAEFLAEWLQAIKPTVRPSTWECYRMNSRARIIPSLGHVALGRLTAADLNALYGGLLENGRRGGKGGLSPRSVRLVHVTLHRALRDAVRWGLLMRNVADLADPPRVPKRILHTWTAEQAARFLVAVRGHRLYAAFLLLLTTGMRRGEVCGLRWEGSLDLETGTLSVRTNRVAVTYANVVEGEPKTARGRRTIPLDSSVVAALKAHRTRQLEERLAWGSAYEDSGLVFTREDGSALHPEQLSKSFDRQVRDAGLPRIPLRDCRHSFATISLATGSPMWAVCDLLGHSSMAVTDSFYRDAVPSAMAEAAGRVASAILRPNGWNKPST